MSILKLKKKGKVDIKIKIRDRRSFFEKIRSRMSSRKPELKKPIPSKPHFKLNVKPAAPLKPVAKQLKDWKIKPPRKSLFERLGLRIRRPEIKKPVLAKPPVTLPVKPEEKEMSEIKKGKKFFWQIKKPEPPATEKHYMKRNVNFSLFFLIIVVLIALAGLTAYYQMTYAEQANTLKQKTEEFTTALNELQVKRVQLNQTSVQLQVESQSKEQLGNLYTTVKQEKEAVEVDLTKTKDTLVSALNELESTKSTLAKAEQEREQYRKEALEWKEDAENCADELGSCNTDLSECNAG